MVDSVHYMSKRQDWGTPQSLFDQWNQQYHFTLDACAEQHNAKVQTYFSPGQNGLVQDWKGRVWCNPPYGRSITGQWVKKGYEESQKHGSTVVMLLPSRTDTAWWHDYCLKGRVHFIRGRVRFEGAESSAPFPSAIVVFGPQYTSI